MLVPESDELLDLNRKSPPRAEPELRRFHSKKRQGPRLEPGPSSALHLLQVSVLSKKALDLRFNHILRHKAHYLVRYFAALEK